MTRRGGRRGIRGLGPLGLPRRQILWRTASGIPRKGGQDHQGGQQTSGDRQRKQGPDAMDSLVPLMISEPNPAMVVSVEIVMARRDIARRFRHPRIAIPGKWRIT